MELTCIQLKCTSRARERPGLETEIGKPWEEVNQVGRGRSGSSEAEDRNLGLFLQQEEEVDLVKKAELRSL